jgi:hypothetical protein
VEQARPADVVEIAALAAEQATVVAPGNRGAEESRHDIQLRT